MKLIKFASTLLVAALPLWGYEFTSGNDDFALGNGSEIPGWHVDTGVVPYGTATVEDGVVTITTVGSQKVNLFTSNNVVLQPGESITFTIRFRGQGSFSLGSYFYIPSPIAWYDQKYGELAEGTADWQDYTTEITNGDDKVLQLNAIISVGNDSCLQFDDFKGTPNIAIPEGWQEIQPGLNDDPNPGPDGVLPYEMQGRTEPIIPQIDFTDCTKFEIVNHGTDARLYRTSEQHLFRDYAGKIVFSALEPKSWFEVRLKEPVAVPEEADCVNMWNYGCSWCWVAEPHLMSSFLFLDSEENEVEVKLEPMYYTYWHIQHILLPRDIPRPLKFAGIRFRGGIWGDISREQKTIYLDSVTMYKQSEKQLDIADLPEKLPFPTTPDTIIPTATSDYQVTVNDNGNVLALSSTAGVEYDFDADKPFLSAFSLQLNGRAFQPFQDACLKDEKGQEIPVELIASRVAGESIVLEYSLPDGHKLTVTAAVHFKSLILDFQESAAGGQIETIYLGRLAGLQEAEAMLIPMIHYGWASQPPQLVRDDDIFFFGHFDWYRSDGSELFAERNLTADSAAVLGGVRYFPTTAGIRNGVQERFVFTASTVVEEVFPNIPNPPSPMRDMMVGRSWRIKPGVDYEDEVEEATAMRARGLSDVAIRYHESTWRDGGESYTFRTEAAPEKGGNPALRKMVQDIQALGWLAGVYTGYNDLAPVNSYWDEDALARSRDGNWITGWARCYQPKPVFARNMEHILAPRIGEIFGNHHVYCDVHTAVAPWIRTDFDSRAPGAGKFRKTFEAFGLLLYEQREAYHGPVYSEGGCHWFYAGLLDGNYAQIFEPRPDLLEWFPDFNLRKIHPLSIDAGMGEPAMFFRGVPRKDEQFIATTLVYGNISILAGDEEQMERNYYLLTPLQPYYVMIPVESIRWFDQDNNSYNTSEAFVNGAKKLSRIQIRYENGFTVYANGKPEQWTVEGHTLPQWGWLAFAPDGKLLGAREILDGHVAEWARGEKSMYLRSPEGWVDAGWIAGQNTVILKREEDGWHLIEGIRNQDFTLTEPLD